MRIGFIGGYGHHYLRGAIKDPAIEVAAIGVAGDGQDNEQARKRLASDENGAEWFDRPEEMLDRFRPDIVSVGSVYGCIGDHAALVLERDIPVVCDKPVAASWDQLARLESLLATPGRQLLTEFPFRSQAEFRAARHAVASGAIGTVVLATAQKSYRFGDSRPAWYGNRADYTGTLLWVASHGIDAIGFATGKTFSRTFGIQGNVSRPDYGTMEDHTVSVFELAGGGSALVHADYLRPAKAETHGDDRLRIAGSRGVVEVRDSRAILITHDEPARDITGDVAGEPVHRALLSAMKGEKDSVYSTAHSLTTARILLHARDAADRGAAVAIDDGRNAAQS